MEKSRTQNFVLDLEWMSGQQFALEVQESPVGEATGTLTLPYTYEEIEGWAMQYGLIINVHDEQRTPPPALKGITPEELGCQLYRALFSGELKSLFEQARRHCEINKHRLRLILRFKTQAEAHIHAMRIPWELLCAPQTNQFICTGQDVSLVRYLEHAFAAKRPPLPAPLRILAVQPNPDATYMDSLDSNGFEEILNKQSDQDHIKLHVLKQPTIDALYDHLLDHSYDVLHFTGHGGHDGQNWGLVFEDDGGQVDFVEEPRFVTAISPCKSLRLVHLVSCDTGRADHQQRFSPFSGLAHALTGAKMPAVVAMQFPILETHAKRYMTTFYDRIAKGDPLDQAVNIARAKLLLIPGNKLAWATPVVFLRDKTGQLFEPIKTQKVHVNTVVRMKQTERDGITGSGYSLISLQDFFRKDTASTNSRMVSYPDAWDEMFERIGDLRRTLKPDLPIHFEGKSFLPIWFALGHCLQQSSGLKIGFNQFNQRTEESEIWRPDPSVPPMEIVSEWERPGADRSDIVLSISIIASRFDRDLSDYMLGTPLGRLPWLKLSLPHRSRRSLAGARDANAFVNAVVQILNDLSLQTVHLFLNVPSAIALFVARETVLDARFQVYHYQKSDDPQVPTYTPAFLLK